MVGKVIALNKDEDTASIIDTETESIDVIETDHNPHEVAVAPDGEKIFISCSLDNKLNVVDSRSYEILDTIEHPDFEFPHGFAVSQKRNKLYLASTYSDHLFVINVDSHEIETILPTHQNKSHMISFTPDEDRAFVANIGSNNITEFDPNKEEITNHFPVGGGPEGIGVHPNGKHLYVANQDDNNLHIIDIDTLETVYERELGLCPVRMVFSPDGKYALIPNRHAQTISVLDTEQPREVDRDLGVQGTVRIEQGETRPWEVKRIPVGVWPGGITFNEDGSYAYVANNKTNDISVIDMTTLTEEKRYDVGTHPDGITFIKE